MPEPKFVPGLPLLTFLVTVAYVPGLPSNAYLGRWLVASVGAALLLWQQGWRGRWQEPGAGHIMGGLLLAWCAMGFAWTVSGWEHAWGLYHLATMAAVYCVATLARQEDIDGCWLGLGLGVSLSAAFSVLQLAGANPVWSLLPGGAVGLFLTKNMAADAAVLALIGAAALSLRIGWSWGLAVVPGALVTAYFTHSRGLMLALYVAAVSTALILSHPRTRLITAYVIAAATVMALGLMWDHLGILNDRLSVWGVYGPNITIMGDGLESTAVASSGLEYAHNEVIQFAFELGVGSLLLWGVVLHALTGQPRHENVIERSALLALLAQSMFWFSFHTPMAAYMGALLAGYLAGCRRRASLTQPSGGGPRVPSVLQSHPVAVPGASGRGGPDLSSGSQHKVVA